jgi:hypothetical protein
VLPRRQRIGNPPRYASFAVDALEKADHHQPENTGPEPTKAAQLLVIELPAAPFTETEK